MSTRRTKTSIKRKAPAKKAVAKRSKSTKRAAKTKRVRVTKSDQATTYSQTPNRSEPGLVLAWFRLLARRRGARLQHLWMNEGSIDGRATVTHAELAGILADQDSVTDETQWVRDHEPVNQWKLEAEEIKRELDTLEDSRFARLAQTFGLRPQELDLLKLCAAVAFDPSLSRACAYLQDHSGRTYLTEELASRLLQVGPASIWSPEMNVFRWELIQRRDVGPGEPPALLCDPQIKEWLIGNSTLDEVLIGAARIEESNGTLPEWPVDEIFKWIDTALENKGPVRLRVVVVAPRGGGKRKFAAAVVQQLRLPLLVVDSDATDQPWRRLFLHAQRQAFLDSAVPGWSGDAAVRQPWPTKQPTFPIQFVLCEPGSEPTETNGTVDRVVRLQIPEAQTRERLWKQSLPAAKKWPAAELRKLVEHHRIWPGDIVRAAQLGAQSPAEAAAIVREGARSRFGSLAQILESQFQWDDLVLPEAVKRQLEAISFEAEDRSAFWEQQEAKRLFPQGRGLVALFSGPSGTGKTMAAQIIASRLTQDLCRVNVAQLVSKWVGETAKNTEQVIRVAAENNAVLFFDEADALFARRSAEIRDAQDRFANTDTAFLLQAIEGYPGIAILATNLKANIDPAFLRRLRYLVEFPKPDAALQRKLWTKLVTALASEERAKKLTGAIELLSTTTEITGAQIKFAILAAMFAARAEDRMLNAHHLLIGLDRELGKEGRAIGPRERDKILRIGEAA